MIAAHEQVARRYGGRYGGRVPRPPRGLAELFWLRLFAPAYRALPWSLRRRIMQSMPGSHRQQWAAPPRPRNPAV